MIYFPARTVGPVLGSPVAYGAVVAGRLGERVGIVTTIGSAETYKVVLENPDLISRQVLEKGYAAYKVFSSRGYQDLYRSPSKKR